MEGGGLLGKNSSDLQENIKITEDNYVTGKLKYVTGYDGFSNKPAEQKGNYLALKADMRGQNLDGAKLSMKYSNSTRSETPLDDDKLMVVRVVEKNGSKGTLSVIAKRDDAEEAYTTVYKLDKLDLDPAD